MKKGIKYHQPELLANKKFDFDANVFIEEKSKAEYSLGQLQGSGGDGLGKSFFNAELLISPLATKEAVMSSKIEGTISTVSDVYKLEAGETPSYSGTAEVLNYRRSITDAIALVQSERKMNKTHLKGLHRTLLTGVRHRGKLGDFRTDDVWIGEKQNDPIEKAIYVPPVPVAVEAYMDDLFGYMEKGKDDPLTKAAIVHYQFEAIHPVEDGNGRVGRLLIPLILFEYGRLSLPILYMSGYFDRHKDEYRLALRETDQTLKYEKWLKFFFRSVAAQATETLNIISKINNLYEKTASKVERSKSPYLHHFLAHIFGHPIFYTAEVIKSLKASYLAASGLIELFEANGLIRKITADVGPDKRRKLYVFSPLIDLLSG